MIGLITRKLLGSQNERYLKQLNPMVDQVNALESTFSELTDDDFPARIAEWKDQVQNQGRDLDELLPEVFACVREAGKRAMGMRHYDVQLVGGAVLHRGRIAEMKTGEGKTLVATLPVVLNALTGKGVHVITVNDYLASRDAEWMGQLYNFLGLSVGINVHGLGSQQKKDAYAADITYGTNNEYGFDYLRDNMAFHADQLVQRPLHFAIVDEVDSILIDEARTPLIISGPSESNTAMYGQVNQLIPMLKKEEHFTVDEKAKSVGLTDEGVQHIESMFKIDNLYDPNNISLQHHVLQALKAHNLFANEVDYIVKDGEVIIVDEFTGRLQPGRRFSDGLHQALEAKENVPVKAESQTFASITYQNYFRMYDKLAGMTGTADTEAVEFSQIYNLEVSVIPTHRDMVRIDHPDVIYKTQQEKYQAIVDDIAELHRKGQPVLVGTVSIEKSELIAKLLKKAKVPHNVLNAKQHEKEAEIVAEAGHKGRVTIATNMAGRGTDIKLGDGVLDLGGLHILGTERHESRRIDNQLRGRSGRQGDPGSSRFYLALDDELMRLFGSERIAGLMDRLGMKEGEPIEHGMVSKAIENAQKRVEAHHFEIRKTLLEYDDVMNQQREVVYDLRRELMTAEDLEPVALDFAAEVLDELYEPIEAAGKEGPDEDTVAEVRAQLADIFNPARMGEAASEDAPLPTRDEAETLAAAVLNELKEQAAGAIRDIAAEREEPLADEQIGEMAKGQVNHLLGLVLLDNLDRTWKEHLLTMDHLREGIGLRGYGQRDPKQEYKREGFELFQDMLYRTKENSIKLLTRLQISRQAVEQPPEVEKPKEEPKLEYSGAAKGDEPKGSTHKRNQPKVGRNDPCPCGSGKKHKKCCGA